MTTKQEWVKICGERIEEYKPHTAWETANNRWLRRLKTYETAAVKAVEREERESKRRKIRERRKQKTV